MRALVLQDLRNNAHAHTQTRAHFTILVFVHLSRFIPGIPVYVYEITNTIARVRLQPEKARAITEDCAIINIRRKHAPCHPQLCNHDPCNHQGSRKDASLEEEVYHRSWVGPSLVFTSEIPRVDQIHAQKHSIYALRRPICAHWHLIHACVLSIYAKFASVCDSFLRTCT